MFADAKTADDVMAKARFLAPIALENNQQRDAFGKINQGDTQGAVETYGAQAMKLVGLIEHEGHFTALFATEAGGAPTVAVTQFANGELQVVSKHAGAHFVPVLEAAGSPAFVGASAIGLTATGARTTLFLPQGAGDNVMDSDGGDNPRLLTQNRDVLFAAVHRYNFPHLHEDDFAKDNPFDGTPGGSADADPKENELYIPTEDSNGRKITVKVVGSDSKLQDYTSTITHEKTGISFFRFFRNSSMWNPKPTDGKPAAVYGAMHPEDPKL